MLGACRAQGGLAGFGTLCLLMNLNELSVSEVAQVTGAW